MNLSRYILRIHLIVWKCFRRWKSMFCSFGKNLTLYHTFLIFKDPEEESFKKTLWGKGENASNQHFLFFPQCFLLFPTQISIFKSQLFCCLQMLSIWTGWKFCRLVKSQCISLMYYSKQVIIDLYNFNFV